MAMRISGIASGLDTDSMVQELVKASSTKKDDLVKAQTKLEWKQDAWKDLNSKIYNFFTSQLDNLKLESAYKKKKTTIADPGIASVVTSSNAVNGTQSLAVTKLAKAGYLTGGKLSSDKSVTGETTLAELAKKNGGSLGESDEISLRVMSGSTETVVSLRGNSSISDVIKTLNGAGVSASFDEANQRIFVNAASSGKENDFAITAGNENGLDALQHLGLLTKDDITSGTDSKTYERYQYWAECYDMGDDYSETNTIFQQKVKETAANKAAELLDSLQAMEDKVTELRDARSKLTSDEDKSKNWLESEKAQKELMNTVNVLKDYYNSIVNDGSVTTEEKEAAQASLDRVLESQDVAKSAADSMGIVLPGVAEYNLLERTRAQGIESAKAAYKALNDTNVKASDSAVRINGQNGMILLNGAEYESDTNSYTINGLTITANSVSAIGADGKPIETTINTSDDVDGIYDTIVNFFKEYNELIKEMDTLYNAESSKGYEPLTDEEKDALSDTEVEKWEKKIKDSLLRRDDNLSTVISTFKEAMLSTFKIDGKTYSLSSFGISTANYFLSGDNEKGVFHIDGNPNDSSTSGNKDLLKEAIANDPDTVSKFFSTLIGNLHTQLNKQMQSTDYRSYSKIYDDKLMKTQYDSYKTKIAEQEKKLQNLEDRYYDQFAQMETALSKLNSTQSYLSNLFGG